MTLAKRLLSLIAALGLAISSAAAHATTISGNFNTHGYGVIDINVATTSNVDITFTGGYGDPMFALFNSAGQHLITNDDSNGLWSHITQSLGAGDYSILVTYCCTMLNALPDSTFSGTDDFNFGSYWIGGSATLAGVTSYLDNFGWAAGESYQFELTNGAVRTTDVPEPQSAALFGAALLALALNRRRQRRG